MRQNASIAQVMGEIAPYVQRHLFSKPTVKQSDIPAMSRLLLSRYKNIEITQRVRGGKPCLQIRTSGFLQTDERELEIIDDRKPREQKKAKERDLSWIDELELLDAALDDD